jgi:hypothetical protein
VNVNAVDLTPVASRAWPNRATPQPHKSRFSEDLELIESTIVSVDGIVEAPTDGRSSTKNPSNTP